MRVLLRSQIRAAEKNAASSGIFSYTAMMKNAGEAAAKIICENFDASGKTCVAVCGRGNNGGDALVVAYEIMRAGANVLLYFPFGMPETDTASAFLPKVRDIKITDCIPDDCDLIIDGLFGIGFEGNMRQGTAWDVINQINSSGAYTVSIDLPSGIDCDGNPPDIAVKADLTVTFIALKPCFLLPATSEYCGRVFVADIGVEPVEYEYETVNKPVIKKRSINSHKGSFGTALLFCGSYGMSGAQILAAKAALSCGVGILKAVVCDKNYEIFSTSVQSAVTLPVPTGSGGGPEPYEKQLLSAFEGASSVLLGCGLGRSEEAIRLVKKVALQTEAPIVLDADGINCIVSDINIIRKIKAPVIITPHPKEMSRLCGVSTEKIEADRVYYAKRFAIQNECIVVLKGHNTVIASPDGRVFFNTTGNSGMATGGSGDVLSGMIVSFLAQGYEALTAAKMSVWLHGYAADCAVKHISEEALSPQDIIEELKTELF